MMDHHNSDGKFDQIFSESILPLRKTALCFRAHEKITRTDVIEKINQQSAAALFFLFDELIDGNPPHPQVRKLLNIVSFSMNHLANCIGFEKSKPLRVRLEILLDLLPICDSQAIDLLLDQEISAARNFSTESR